MSGLVVGDYVDGGDMYEHWARCDDCDWESPHVLDNMLPYVHCRAHNAAEHDWENFELSVPTGRTSA